MNQPPKLSGNIRDYIGRDSPRGVAIQKALAKIVVSLPDTVIFGGMLRDLALGKFEQFRSDIDLVTRASTEDLARAIRPFNPSRNRFGGYRFIVDEQQFDIWALQDTWALRHGVVDGKDFNDLLKTTFFNLDAIVFHLRTEECLCDDSYQEMVRLGILEVNLEPNPRPHSMALRAISMVARSDLALGPRLATFVLTNLNRSDLDRVGITGWDGLKAHVERGCLTPYRFAASTRDRRPRISA